MKNKLLASSPTIDGIAACINEYFYSLDYTVNANTLAIEHPTETLPAYRVIRKGSRFRFELIGGAA